MIPLFFSITTTVFYRDNECDQKVTKQNERLMGSSYKLFFFRCKSRKWIFGLHGWDVHSPVQPVIAPKGTLFTRGPLYFKSTFSFPSRCACILIFSIIFSLSLFFSPYPLSIQGKKRGHLPTLLFPFYTHLPSIREFSCLPSFPFFSFVYSLFFFSKKKIPQKKKMRANDFSVTTPEGQSRWCITHTPSGAEVLSLAKHAYSSVAVLQEGGKLFVRASYPDTTYLDMPIRNDENTQQQQQPEAILSVEVLGTQHVVIVHANLGETVAQLKLRLASQCGIPAHEQALWLGKSQIESDRLPLRSTGLAVPGAYVRVGRSGKLRIGVRCGASVARLMVYPATTVAQLREIAGSKMNISLVRPVVAFAGRELAEEATLRECGIRAGYEVDLVARGGHLKAEQSGVVHKEEGGGEMGEVLGTVATLVGQQAALQETVSHLLQSYAGSSVKRRSPHHPLAYAGAPPGEDPSRAVDILSQSRKLRATASMEASSALSMTQVSGLPPPEIPHGNRTGVFYFLSQRISDGEAFSSFF